MLWVNFKAAEETSGFALDLDNGSEFWPAQWRDFGCRDLRYDRLHHQRASVPRALPSASVTVVSRQVGATGQVQVSKALLRSSCHEPEPGELNTLAPTAALGKKEAKMAPSALAASLKARLESKEGREWKEQRDEIFK